MLAQHDLDDLIERLERNGIHRVLKKLSITEGRTSVPYNGGTTFIGVAVDVETTGLDPQEDRIIELAMRRFRYDTRGRILKIDKAESWFEDPKVPLSEEITRLTGLTDAGLVGQMIDEPLATRILLSSHLVIAHNAAFDRKFIESRFPAVTGLPWACSMAEVDWARAGFDGRALGWLGLQAGWFHEAHRAIGDVDALIGLLSHALTDGRTVLAELTDNSAKPSLRVEAIGADFAVKDQLRSRGYRWDANMKVWWREIAAGDRAEEETWLGRFIYSATTRARALGPRITEVTARDRYR